MQPRTLCHSCFSQAPQSQGGASKRDKDHTGHLQTSTDVAGPWSTIGTNVLGPWPVDLRAQPKSFFRLATPQ